MAPDSSSADLEASLRILREVAARAATAGRLEVASQQQLLEHVADTVRVLFSAKAASVALYEPETQRLTFRAASGEQGPAVVGMSVAPSEGIVGFVFSTGEPVALADITADPRFDRAVAERVGYVPRSVLAVPLQSNGQIAGVIEAFDKGGDQSFSVRDMELASAFAAQAATAIAGTRVLHDLPRLLALSLERVAPDLAEDQVEALVGEATAGLDAAADDPFWSLVDQVARLRGLGDSELELVGDILDAVATHRGHRAHGIRAAR